MLTDPNNNTIILSGCGTSGRVAFFVARAFNLVMAQSGQAQCFQYVILRFNFDDVITLLAIF